MKKVSIMLTILVIGTGWMHLAAQSVVSASVESEYRAEAGKDVRICVDPGNGATVIYYRDTVLDTNCFIYHVQGQNSDYKFIWPSIPEGSGRATCSVEDMKVVGDTFYFCGTATYPDNGVTRKKGYLGWAPVSKLRNPSPGNWFHYYSKFEDPSNTTIHVAGLSHMDGCFESNETFLGLVGTVRNSSNDTTSCLLLVKKTSGGWDCQFHYITDTKETFTDIVFLGGHDLAVTSRFGHEYMDHYRFGIRYENIGTAFGMVTVPLPEFQTVYKFNTHSMTTPSSVSPYPTWHGSDVKIKITDDPSCSCMANVAYECEDTAKQCENRMQTALFRMDFGHLVVPVDLRNAQLVHGYFRDPHTFIDLRNTLVNNDSAVLLLHRGRGDDGEMASTLLFPTWSHYGKIDGLLADYRRNTSLDVHKRQYIRLGGVSLTDRDVLHYHLDKQYISSSCYSTRPIFYNEKLIYDYSVEQKTSELKKSQKKQISWNSYSMTGTITNKITSCETKTIQE